MWVEWTAIIGGGDSKACYTGQGKIILVREKSVKSQVINKGYFSDAFLFKPRGGHSPPSGLNRKPRKNPLFSL